MENEVGKRIKILREALNLTQKEFAGKIGRTVRAIQRYESGQRSPDETTLRLIEQTFNVNPEWLRKGKGEMFLQKEELTRDPFELVAEKIVNMIIKKRGIKIPEEKRRKVVKKLAELIKQVGEKEALDLIDIAV